MTSGVVSDGLNMMAYFFRTFSILRFRNYPINFPIKGNEYFGVNHESRKENSPCPLKLEGIKGNNF